jgi:hypothetical protein
MLRSTKPKAARTSKLGNPRTKNPSGQLIAMMQETHPETYTIPGNTKMKLSLMAGTQQMIHQTR